MEALCHSAAGIVINEDKLEVCLQKGKKNSISESFEKSIRGILEMGIWLEEAGTEIAGVFNSDAEICIFTHRILEAFPFNVMAVNEEKLKKEHTRETGISEAQWLANMIRYGMVNIIMFPDVEAARKEIGNEISVYKEDVKKKKEEIEYFYNSVKEAGFRFTDYIPDLEDPHAAGVLEKIVSDSIVTEADILALGVENKTRVTPYDFAAALNMLSGSRRKMLKMTLGNIELCNQILEHEQEIIEKLVLLQRTLEQIIEEKKLAE